MKIQTSQLRSALKQGLARCYLVTGDEHLLVAEALDAIRAAAREQGFTARDRHVTGPGFDWAAVCAAGANLSLFAERRIVEIVLPTGKPGREGGAALVELAETLHCDTLLIVTGARLDRGAASAKWAKTLQKIGVFVPVWPIERRDLPGWIAARMRAVDLEPDRDAIAMLTDRVEGNLLAASQEIQKLRLMLGAGPVSAAAIDAAVANSSRFDVYKLADAALGGNAARAVAMLHSLRGEGVEPVLAVWALTRELRTLARLREVAHSGGKPSAGMQKLGVWRNRQGLMMAALERHSLAGAYRLLRRLGRVDASAKGQAPGDPWQMLATVVIELAGGSSGRRAA